MNMNKVFQPNIKEFDVKKAKEHLKVCSKIVRDYVKLIEESNERWKLLCGKAIGKLRNKAVDELGHHKNWKFCPGCGKKWELDSEAFGCWSCGYII